MTRPDAKPALTLVTPESGIYELMKTPETTAERVRRLQAEARALAVEEIERLERLLREAGEAAKAIAAGGDAYPVGARELGSRLAEDLPAKAETLRAIALRF
jgi:hypothetical protein